MLITRLNPRLLRHTVWPQRALWAALISGATLFSATASTQEVSSAEVAQPASKAKVLLLEEAAAELLPAADLARLAAQKWFETQPDGCRFRLADPPSSFTQFFTSTDLEGLTERDCGKFRLIGVYKKNQLIGPAAWRSKENQNILMGPRWVNDNLQGEGAVVYADGIRIEGPFVASHLEGPVVMHRLDGSVSKGVMSKSKWAAGEVRTTNAQGELLRITTIGSDGNGQRQQLFEGGQLTADAPLVDNKRQGFGFKHWVDSQGFAQKKAALWKDDLVVYESPSLLELQTTPCTPLITGLGVFMPVPDSCGPAALATIPPPPPPPVAPELGAATPPDTATGSAPASALDPAVAAAIAAETLPTPPAPIKTHPFAAYSEDGRHFVRGLIRNGELVVDEVGFDGGQRRYKSKSMDSSLNGVARYYQNDELVFDGAILEGAFDGSGLCRFNGSLERCEYAYGERVDQLFKTRLELEAYKSAKQQEQEQLMRAHQEKLAIERRRAEALQAQRQAAAQQEQGGFQWGKLAALGVGALAGGITKLPTDVQADMITSMVADSMAGQQGVSNMQSSMQAATAKAGGGGGTGSALLSAGPSAQKPARQIFNYQATCPIGGAPFNIPVPYRTQACLEAAKDFAYTYACNDADRFAEVTSNCQAACGGSPQCQE